MHCISCFLNAWFMRFISREVTSKMNSSSKHKWHLDNKELEIYSLGNYTIQGITLGRGNFAKVVMATHKIIGAAVALKMIDADQVKEAYVVQNLEREVRILSRLNHPNIVKLYEAAWNKSLYCIILEYMRGGDLGEYVKRQPMRRLKENQARHFMQQIVAAVAYMHSVGILHRDLKLDNIMMENPSTVKIVDFGLSNFYDPKQPLRTRCGSPEYAAPELFTSDVLYGPGVDLWSLGVILYVMVVGVVPFTYPMKGSLNAEGKRQLLFKKASKGLRASHKKAMIHLSESCRDLICSMLQPNLKSRATLDAVVQHPWLAHKEGNFPAIKSPDPNLRVKFHPEVMRRISTLTSESEKDIEEHIQVKRYGAFFAMYHLLMDSMLKNASDKSDKISPWGHLHLKPYAVPQSKRAITTKEEGKETIQRNENQRKERNNNVNEQIIQPKTKVFPAIKTIENKMIRNKQLEYNNSNATELKATFIMEKPSIKINPKVKSIIGKVSEIFHNTKLEIMAPKKEKNNACIIAEHKQSDNIALSDKKLAIGGMSYDKTKDTTCKFKASINDETWKNTRNFGIQNNMQMYGNRMNPFENSGNLFGRRKENFTKKENEGESKTLWKKPLTPDQNLVTTKPSVQRLNEEVNRCNNYNYTKIQEQFRTSSVSKFNQDIKRKTTPSTNACFLPKLDFGAIHVKENNSVNNKNERPPVVILKRPTQQTPTAPRTAASNNNQDKLSKPAIYSNTNRNPFLNKRDTEHAAHPNVNNRAPRNNLLPEIRQNNKNNNKGNINNLRPGTAGRQNYCSPGDISKRNSTNNPNLSPVPRYSIIDNHNKRLDYDVFNSDYIKKTLLPPLFAKSGATNAQTFQKPTYNQHQPWEKKFNGTNCYQNKDFCYGNHTEKKKRFYDFPQDKQISDESRGLPVEGTRFVREIRNSPKPYRPPLTADQIVHSGRQTSTNNQRLPQISTPYKGAVIPSNCYVDGDNTDRTSNFRRLQMPNLKYRCQNQGKILEPRRTSMAGNERSFIPMTASMAKHSTEYSPVLKKINYTTINMEHNNNNMEHNNNNQKIEPRRYSAMRAQRKDKKGER